MEKQQVIDRYKVAYKAANGREPVLTFRGSWVYIGDSPTAYRWRKLAEMAECLERGLETSTSRHLGKG